MRLILIKIKDNRLNMNKQTDTKFLKSKLNFIAYKFIVVESLARILTTCMREPSYLELYDCECLQSVLYNKIKDLHSRFNTLEKIINNM